VDDVRSVLQRIAGDKVAVSTLGDPSASDPSPVREDVMRAVTRAVHAEVIHAADGRSPSLRLALTPALSHSPFA